MAGPLTWRDVAPPDMSAATRGMESFNTTLNTALQGAVQGVDRWDKKISASQNSELALRILENRDAGALEQALTSGELVAGIRRERIDPNVLAQANRQILDLESLADTRMDRGWKITDRERSDSDYNGLKSAFSESASDYAVLEDWGSTDEAKAQARANIQGRIGQYGLSFDAAVKLRESMKDREKFVLDTTQTRDSITQGRDNHGFTIEDRAIVKQAAELANALGSYTPEEQAMLLSDSEFTKGYDPRAIAAYRGQSGTFAFQGGGALGGPTSTGIPGGGGGGASPAYRNGDPHNAVFGDGTDGLPLPPKPITEMTIGEAHEWGRTVLNPATKKKGYGISPTTGKVLGTSALGGYQFITGTLEGLAKQEFGSNWRSVPMNAANQERMAKRLFEQTKHGNLKQTWEGLPDARPGAYAKMTWEQFKPHIFKHEVGYTGNPVMSNSATDAAMSSAAAKKSASQSMTGTVRGAIDHAAKINSQSLGLQGTIDYVRENAPKSMTDNLSDADIEQAITQIQGAVKYTHGRGLPASQQRVETPTMAEAAAMVIQMGSRVKGFWDNLDRITGSPEGLTGGRKIGVAQKDIVDIYRQMKSPDTTAALANDQVMTQTPEIREKATQTLVAANQAIARISRQPPSPARDRLLQEYQKKAADAAADLAVVRSALGAAITPPTPAAPAARGRTSAPARGQTADRQAKEELGKLSPEERAKLYQTWGNAPVRPATFPLQRRHM